MQQRHRLVLFFSTLLLISGTLQAQEAGESRGGGYEPRAGELPAPIPGMSAPRQASVDSQIPFSPGIIRELAKRAGESTEATEQAGQFVAFPESRRVNVTFAPGQPTSIIQAVHGYSTAVSFFDSTGQPWPIEWNTNSNAATTGSGSNCSTSENSGSGGGGNPTVLATGFSVCVPVKGSNVVEIMPISRMPRGALNVMLVNAPKPVTFLLVAGKEKYDSDVSIRVADRGPKAKIAVDSSPNAPTTGSPFLTSMLSGMAPADAVPLSVIGVSPDEIRAWRLGGDTFVRTRYTLMTPPYVGAEQGEGNVTIYQIPNTPYILLSADGHTVSAQLKEEH